MQLVHDPKIPQDLKQRFMNELANTTDHDWRVYKVVLQYMIEQDEIESQIDEVIRGIIDEV